MTSPQEHYKNFKQFQEDINEKIRANLLLERQKIIGFTVSEASTNLLEYYFHKLNLISPGFQVNHNFFSSEKRAERMLDFEFPLKTKIIPILVKIEELRDLLCYGKEKKVDKVQEGLTALQKMKELISQKLGEEL